MQRTHFRLQRRVPLVQRLVAFSVLLFIATVAIWLPSTRPASPPPPSAEVQVLEREAVMVVRQPAERTPRPAPPAAFSQHLP